MKRTRLSAIAATYWLLSFSSAIAQTPAVPPTVLAFIGKVIDQILNPIIALLFALALVYFVFGVVKYIWNPDNEEERTNGRTAMIWGIAGMFVMVSVFGILRLIIYTFGLDPSLLDFAR
jgi:uncharacterized membrane protein YidH (DUF202 family)